MELDEVTQKFNEKSEIDDSSNAEDFQSLQKKQQKYNEIDQISILKQSSYEFITNDIESPFNILQELLPHDHK